MCVGVEAGFYERNLEKCRPQDMSWMACLETFYSGWERHDVISGYECYYAYGN